MDLTPLVEDIRTRSGIVTMHREKRMVLVQRCEESVNKLNEKEVALGQHKLEAMLDLADVLLKIRGKVSEWGEHGQTKYFMQQDYIAGDISILDGLLATHAIKFKTVDQNELRLQQNKMTKAQQDDQSELNALIFQLVRNTDDLQQLAREAEWEGIRALMQAIQERLQVINANSDNAQALRRGLGILYTQTNSEVVPPLINLNGQITDRSGSHVIKTTTGVCDGLWMGTMKVMLKSVPRMGGPEGAKLVIEREAKIWHQLKHNHVLPFYGTYCNGPSTFAVFSWTEHSNLDVYIQDYPNCERMRILAEVALGLKYLHTFQPVVVHGDLRAANVRISATGSALISDFGWGNIAAETVSIDSTRWMSPELLRADSWIPTTQSDVWSFGMLCLEVLTGQVPFWNFETDSEVELVLKEGHTPELPEHRKDLHERGLSDEMWSLMNNCWTHKSDLRPEMRLLAMDVRKLHQAHWKNYRPSASDLPAPPSSIRPEMHTNRQGQKLPPLATEATVNMHRSYDTGSSHTSTTNMDSEEERTRSEHLNPWPCANSVAAGDGQLPGTSDDSLTAIVRSQSTLNNRPSSRRSSYIAEYCLDRAYTIEFDEPGDVLRGSLEELVERLLAVTHVSKTDARFRECFLTIYQGFTSTKDLWDILVNQHMLASRQSGDPKKQKHMLMVLSDWLDIQCIGSQDRDFLCKMEIFISRNQWDAGEPETEQRKLAIKIKGLLTSMDSSPCLPTNEGGNESFNLNTRSLTVASEIAEQLVRIEGDLFQKILASECASWAVNVSEEELPNIHRFIQNNGRISDWCVLEILKPDRSEGRARVIYCMVQIMNHCLTKNAFSSVQAILSALTHTHVQRLPLTQGYVGSSEREKIEEISRKFDTLTQSGGSVGRRRGAFWRPRPTHNKTCIPPLTKRLNELRQFHEERRNSGDTLINFQHFTELWKRSKELVEHEVPQIRTGRDPTSAAYRYLEQELGIIEADTNFQARLESRRRDVARQEEQESRRNIAAVFDSTGFVFK